MDFNWWKLIIDINHYFQQLFMKSTKKIQQVIDEENDRVVNDTQTPGSIIKMDTQFSCQPKNGTKLMKHHQQL